MEELDGKQVRIDSNMILVVIERGAVGIPISTLPGCSVNEEVIIVTFVPKPSCILNVWQDPQKSRSEEAGSQLYQTSPNSF